MPTNITEYKDLSVLGSFKSRFDKVYVLSLVNRKDRQQHISDELNKISLPRPDETNYVRWYYAVPFPHNDIITAAFNNSNRGRFTKINEYDCARNHYNIVKICYELGCEHCLIIEDDILFYNDKQTICDCLANIPEDYDILQFGGFTADPKIQDYTNDINNTNKYWCEHRDVGVWNCSMYALSRRGMEFYLAFMDRFFWVADGPVFKAPINDKIVKTYISRFPVVIQEDKNKITSDIRNSDNDDINYNTDNMYEHNIDKSLYTNSKN